MANTWIGKPQKDIDNRLSEINSLIQRSDSGEAPLSDDSRKSLNDEILQIAEANRVSQDCTNRNADVGWMRENIEELGSLKNEAENNGLTMSTTFSSAPASVRRE